MAIDAGHGGQDTGARHHGTNEKDITLALAKEVKDQLDGRPGIRAFLVRKGDYFIPLRRRWTLAEKLGRPLTVIHVPVKPYTPEMAARGQPGPEIVEPVRVLRVESRRRGEVARRRLDVTGSPTRCAAARQPPAAARQISPAGP